jgi:hypothetical protein
MTQYAQDLYAGCNYAYIMLSVIKLSTTTPLSIKLQH